MAWSIQLLEEQISDDEIPEKDRTQHVGLFVNMLGMSFCGWLRLSYTSDSSEDT